MSASPSSRAARSAARAVAEQLSLDLRVPPLVALYSPVPQCGKSLVAEYLADFYGYHVVSFAAPLKAGLAAILESAGLSSGTIEACLSGCWKERPLRELGGKTTRYAMQTLGTQWGRDIIDKNLWVNIALRQITALRRAGHPVVVDDMRFGSEYAALAAAGAMTVSVVRPQVVEHSTHHGAIGEGLLDCNSCDHMIVNDGTPEDLFGWTHDMARKAAEFNYVAPKRIPDA